MRRKVQAGQRLKLTGGAAAALLLALVSAPHETTFAQVKKPITKDGLIKAVQLNGLSTRELVQQLQSRGVEFQMTPQVESELRGAGARPEVVAAARSAYRPAAGNARRGAPAAPSSNVPDGPPLSKGEVVTLLQSGVGAARVEQFVERRGVNFTDTCAGTLFVTKTDVTFKADDGQDTFEAEDSHIKEIKTNTFVGGDRGAFHIKVRREKDSKNYNFAPLTKKKDESKLIVALVRGYQAAAAAAAPR